MAKLLLQRFDHALVKLWFYQWCSLIDLCEKLTPSGSCAAVLDYNATFINDFGFALLNYLAGSAKADAGINGTFVSPVSVMLSLALLLNGAAPGSPTFWCAAAGLRHISKILVRDMGSVLSGFAVTTPRSGEHPV